MIWMQQLWARRTDVVFSRVAFFVILAVAVAAALATLRVHLMLGAAVFVVGALVAIIAYSQHRIRYVVGAAARGDDLLRWVGEQGGSFSLDPCKVADSSFDIGRVLWRMGVDADAVVCDAVRRSRDGALVFVADHRRVEQFLVIPTPVLPTVHIDTAAHPELPGQRVGGHHIQSDDLVFAQFAASADALIHIEQQNLGEVSFVDGYLVSRSAHFVDADTVDQRLDALRQLLRDLPRQVVRRYSREDDLVTRLRPALAA